jgi:glucokinase
VIQQALARPAMEIGGSHVAAAMVDLAAGALEPGSSRRKDLDAYGGADEILGQVLACGAGLPAGPGERWGVALPGPFDYDRGIARYAGVGKFEALYGTDVGKALTAGLPGPPGSVAFLNDAEAFAWGEWLFGSAQGYDRCVFLTLGTGIGSAFLADGTVQRSGPGVPPNGEVHFLLIEGQPLEEVVSTRAIDQEYTRRTGAAARGGAEVARVARAGDMAAAAVLNSAFRHLGAALRPYLAIFAPQVIVVGGAMTGSWDLIGPPFKAGLYGHGDETPEALRDLSITLAAHLADAALLGAAAYAQGLVGRRANVGGAVETLLYGTVRGFSGRAMIGPEAAGRRRPGISGR